MRFVLLTPNKQSVASDQGFFFEEPLHRGISILRGESGEKQFLTNLVEAVRQRGAYEMARRRKA